MSKKLFMLVALIVLIATFVIPALAQSDAGFLEGFPGDGRWWCLDQNGSPVAPTPYIRPSDYGNAVAWCAAHGYSW